MVATMHEVSSQVRPRAALRPNPLNPREPILPESVAELADSIRAVGILQPLLITRENVVVAGHRRLKAAELAGLDYVPVVVRDFTPSEELSAMLCENLQRADLTLLEEARAYEQLKGMGLARAEIARRVGVNHDRVKRALALLKLDPNVQQMFAREELPVLLIPVLGNVADPVMQRRLAVAVARRRMKIVEVEEIIKKNRGIFEEKPKPKPAPTPVAAPAPPTVEVKGRKDAMDYLALDPNRRVSYSELHKLFDDVCGTCADCGMSTIETVCRECPLPAAVARLVSL